MTDQRNSSGSAADCCAESPAPLNRRRFVAAAGAAVLAAPAARAQQPPGLPRLAWVCPVFPVESLTEAGPPHFAAFLNELVRLGYVEGQTLALERWSGLNYPDYTEFVRAVVASAPDVIFACGYNPITPMLLAEAKAFPIVFAGGDPQASGIVANLARPGGNITGVTAEPGIDWAAKLVQLITEAVPNAKRVGYLAPPFAWDLVETLLGAAQAQLGIEVVSILVEAPYDAAKYDLAFAQLATQSLDALAVAYAPENNGKSKLIAEKCLAVGLPAIQSWREFADHGGLMSYAPDRAVVFRNAAEYCVRVLNGSYPGDLPIQQPDRFEFVINLRTARALGIVLPETLLSFATSLID